MAESERQHSLAEALALSPSEQAAFMDGLSEAEASALLFDWSFWARPKQLEGFLPGSWRFWLILAGRGFGKTRSGSQWIIDQVENHGARRIALVAETAADARDVMVEGNSGILRCSPPWNPATYEPSKRRITWKNGAIATTYSAETPDQLRGPEHDAAWCDEIAKWRYADTWDQLNFGLRIGSNPRVCITTTPRPTPIVKMLVADPMCKVTKGSTFENVGNLAPAFMDTIKKKYGGTRLGRQELYAEILDDAPGALWKRAQIEDDRVTKLPELVRVVVAIDPSVSADTENETVETGIIVAGLGIDGHGYVLADGSLSKPTPTEWGHAAIALYYLHECDRIVGEVNNGGDLVESNIASIEKNLPFKSVRASRGKAVRAEPIASLYEQHRVHHVGMFSGLEDQQVQWEPGVSSWSPDRVDALVWALTELMLGPEVDDSGVTRIRSNRRR